MKKEKEKEKLEIQGLMKDELIYWKKNLTCVCNNSNDIHNCKFCKYQQQENSLPKKPFTATDGKNKNRLVTKIKIIRGSQDEISAWVF